MYKNISASTRTNYSLAKNQPMNNLPVKHALVFENMKNLIFLLSLSVVIYPAYAGMEENFIVIFEKYNNGNKTQDTMVVLESLVKTQRSVLKECLENNICGKTALESMQKYALVNIKYKGLKEITKDVAYQLNYNGKEVSGRNGFGYTLFVKEDDKWKISTTSWKYK